MGTNWLLLPSSPKVKSLCTTLSNSTDLAYITAGASSGIGEACAWRLAEAGCKLIITARRIDRLEQLKAQLTERYNVPVHAVQLDMRDLDAVKALPEQLPDEFKQVRHLQSPSVVVPCMSVAQPWPQLQHLTELRALCQLPKGSPDSLPSAVYICSSMK